MSETFAVPDEFIDPEGTAEDQDPDLAADGVDFATPTSTLRSLWERWMCRKGDGTLVDVSFFGRTIGGVPEPAVDAYRALELALTAAGYRPASQWAYNCRKIAGTDAFSLHSAGIAIDIDPTENPYSIGDRFSGRLKEHHVTPVLAIKNARGATYGIDVNNASISLRVATPAGRAKFVPDQSWQLLEGVAERAQFSIILGADAQTESWAHAMTDFPRLDQIGERYGQSDRKGHQQPGPVVLRRPEGLASRVKEGRELRVGGTHLTQVPAPFVLRPQRPRIPTQPQSTHPSRGQGATGRLGRRSSARG